MNLFRFHETSTIFARKGANMEMIGNMKAYTLDEMTDEIVGKVGTPERAALDRDVEDALIVYKIGETVKAKRLEQKLTQEQLGKKMGVKKAQISRLERGYSISIPTMRRILIALGVTTASLDMGEAGSIKLW